MQLADGDQTAAPAQDMRDLAQHMLVEEVAADAEEARGIVGADGETGERSGVIRVRLSGGGDGRHAPALQGPPEHLPALRVSRRTGFPVLLGRATLSALTRAPPTAPPSTNRRGAIWPCAGVGGMPERSIGAVLKTARASRGDPRGFESPSRRAVPSPAF
jgi:hypothetical protein